MLSEQFFIVITTLNYPERAKCSNTYLLAGGLIVLHYATSAYCSENTSLNEPSFKRLWFPLVSTSFWEVSVQCRLLYNHILSYKLLTNYYTFSTLPSWFILAELKAFHQHHINLASLCGNGQPITMYASFVCNWQTLLLYFWFYDFASKGKYKVVSFVDVSK